MYIVTKDNNIWLVLKNDIVDKCFIVTHVFLSKDKEITFDKNIRNIIKADEVMFSTTDKNIVKEMLSDNSVQD